MSDVISSISIPLNKLAISPLNVRKTDRKADVDALAASIKSHGLLQNLNVIARGDDKYEVVAGGRRLAALKALVKAGALARDFSVPCRVLSSEQAREASLAENIQRVDMDAIDEVDAYNDLVQEGSSPEDIARRYGTTVRHVQQRLALASLSPKIKAAWKRGDVTLDAARAFCLVADHTQQDAVFKSLVKPVTHASSVRARLMCDRMRSGDRLARFVGLEAYELAGGSVVRDLFDEDAVYIGDPSLMTRLAEQKLEADQQEFLRDGWGWAETNLAGQPVAGSRIQPEWRDHTPSEEAELSRLREDMRVLDDALDGDSVEDDPRWDERDDLAGQIEALRQAARVWDPALMALSGVVLSISHDGALLVTRGIVRPADEKAVRDYKKSVQSDQASDAGDDQVDAAKSVSSGGGLPRPLIRDLSLARTRAIRFKLASDIDTCLALAVAAMLQRQHFRAAMPGVDISAHSARVGDFDEFHDVVAPVAKGYAAEGAHVLTWCLAQSRDALLGVLAVLTAQAVDLSHERGSPEDRIRQKMADELCEALRIDMKEFWQADDEFWSRLPKSELLAALADSPEMENASASKRQAQHNAWCKLKKDELIARVSSAYANELYVPEMFIVEPPQGAFTVTEPENGIVAA